MNENIVQETSETSEINKSYSGWILLSFALMIFIIIIIIAWTISIIDTTSTLCSNCFGNFGIEIGVDANVLNTCGTSGNTPCSFSINSLSDAQTQCDNLNSICQAFTFNPTTSTMKIVLPVNTYISPQTTLYVRQSCPFST